MIDITIYSQYLSRKSTYVRIVYVEFTSINKNSVKLKSKTASFLVNPTQPASDVNGLLYFSSDPTRSSFIDGVIVLDCPGEYEIGGVKIKGDRYDDQMMFSLKIDGLSLLVGGLSLLEKVHGKLQENDLALIWVDKSLDPSFVSALATSGVLYFGEESQEFGKTFLKDGFQSVSKFATTKEKLPQEMATLLLQ